MNEVPTYQPPEGVRGPTLGRDLPDGCERLGASLVPSSDEWWSSPVVSAGTLYWWRFPPLTASQEARSTPPPVPPWPGAVLSGLCDEDGVPTWLAQAGQVRGEQVRGWRDMAWYRPHGHSSDTWVEVRAPRAVPAAPVTERVPWWEAKDRNGLAGDPFVEVGSDDEGPWVRVVEGGTKLHSPVAPDGTVEVLKDGAR